jgi:hypothetical protein
MKKIETSGGLEQGWLTPNSWEKGEEVEEERIIYTFPSFG